MTAKDYQLMRRCSHVSDPDMKGHMLEISSDGTEVHVQWVGGTKQWLSVKEVRV